MKQRSKIKQMKQRSKKSKRDTERINLSCSQELKDRLIEFAKKDDVSLSAYIKKVLNHHIRIRNKRALKRIKRKAQKEQKGKNIKRNK